MLRSVGRTQGNQQAQRLVRRLQREADLASAVAQLEDEVTDAEAAGAAPPSEAAQPVALAETGGGGGVQQVAEPNIAPAPPGPAAGSAAGQPPAPESPADAPEAKAGEQAAATSPESKAGEPAPSGTPERKAGETAGTGPAAKAGEKAAAGAPESKAGEQSAGTGSAAKAGEQSPAGTTPESKAGEQSAAGTSPASKADEQSPAGTTPESKAGERSAAGTSPASKAGEQSAAGTSPASKAGEQSAAGTTPEAKAGETAGTSPASKAGEQSPEDDEELKRAGPVQRFVGPGADPAFQGAVAQVRGAAAQEKAHAPGEAKAAEAAAAAQMPQEERLGLAQNAQAGAVAQAAEAQAAQAQGGQAPGFNKAAFIASVRSQIDQLTPSDPQKMENIEGSGVFDGAKQAVDTQVQGGKQAAQGSVDDRLEQRPDAGSVPERQAAPLQPETAGAAPAVDGTGAAPKPRGQGEVEAPLQAESAGLDTQMASAGVTEEQIAKSNEPTFQSAIEGKKQAQAKVAADVPAYRAGEQAAVTQAQGQADAQAQAGVGGMHDARAAAFAQVGGVKGQAKRGDEAKRAEVGRQIDQLYSAAKTDVEGILTSLDTRVDQEFSAGAAAAKAAAVDYIKRETKAYKDRRYQRDAAWYDIGAHVEGALTHVGDALTDMPPEYYEIYRQGRDLYTGQMDAVIGRVADIVGDHLARAKARIEQGKQEIADFVARQPASLREVARQAAEQANGRFGELEQSVDSKADEVAQQLAQRYVEAAQALDDELSQMKQEDKGLLARAADAIGGVINTIRQIADMLSSTLQRAADAVTTIIRDPIGFLGNLISGIGQGLRQFGANILTHLQTGLIDWLTGAIGSAGIQLPTSWDLPGIFTMVMQLLGLTWQNIRGRIVRALGPRGDQIMGALEQAWEVVRVIQSEGLAGLWRFVQQMVGDLKSMVIDQIKTMISEQVIRAGIEWLVGLLGGPAGAFIKAAQAIIRIVQWFMSNGARVLSLVNAVIDSVSAIAAGNIGGAANFIEQALAKAIPTVISFLADLLGLGGIARKVQEIIRRVQEPINKAIDWVVGKAMAIGRRLLGALRGGGRGARAGAGQLAAPGAGGDSGGDERQARLRAAIRDSYALFNVSGATVESVRKGLPEIKEQYQLASLQLISDQHHRYHIEAKINPELPGPPGKLWTEAELQEIEAVAKDIASKINENESKRPGEKAKFVADPVGFLSNKKTSKGKDNAYRSQLGPAVEAAGGPGLAQVAAEGGLTLLRNVGLQCLDSRGKQIGGVRTELDFLLLGPSSVVEIVSAKLDAGKVSPKTDREALRHIQSFPAAGPANMLTYITSNPGAFGNPSGYRDVASAQVVHSGGSAPLEAFRSQYLSKAVVDDITVKGLAPSDQEDRGYQLRFTERELVEKVAELALKHL